MARTAVIVIGGGGIDPRVVAHLPADRMVIAADSGLDHAMELGLEVDLLVGDLDSVSQQALAEASARGTPVERHRPDKDATDTELAIAAAVERGLHPPDRRRWSPPRRQPPGPRAGRAAGLRRARPGRPRGRALVGAGPRARPPRPGHRADRRPARRRRLAAPAPRSRHRRHDHRTALPAPSRAADPGLGPGHQQRGRRGHVRPASTWRPAPSSSSIPSPLEARHAPTPDPPRPGGPRRLLVLPACGSDSSSGGGATTAAGSSAGSGRGSAAPAAPAAALTLLTYDAFTEPDALAAVHEGHRHRGRGGQGRRRRHAGQQGHPDRRPARGRRAVGGRQHPALPGRRREGLRRRTSRASSATLAPDAVSLVPGHEVTPVDSGDVCLNYDKGWFADKGLRPPPTFDDLIDPAYKGLLVVENPATSSPGLAFLLATVAHFGDPGYEQYWASSGPTTCRWSRTGTRPTTPRSPRAAARATGPIVVSYALQPAGDDLLRRRARSRPRRRRRRSTPRASARSSSPASCGARSTRPRPSAWSTSSSERTSRASCR